MRTLHHFLPVCVRNSLSQRLASSTSGIFEASLKNHKKSIKQHCCDLLIHASQGDYYTVQWQWVDSAEIAKKKNTKQSWFWRKIPLFNVIYERYRSRLIHSIFDPFLTVILKECWPEGRKLKSAPDTKLWQNDGLTHIWSVIENVIGIRAFKC